MWKLQCSGFTCLPKTEGDRKIPEDIPLRLDWLNVRLAEFFNQGGNAAENGGRHRTAALLYQAATKVSPTWLDEPRLALLAPTKS